MVALQLFSFNYIKNSASFLKASPPSPTRLRAVNTKPEMCTADELHYVPVSTSGWKLALWRYLPNSLTGQKRNHPLLLLSGMASSAIGYDLTLHSSFARFMSGQGFDTWILELRGVGLSLLNVDSDEAGSVNNINAHKSNSGFLNGFPDMFDDFLKQIDQVLKYSWDFDHYLEEDLPAAMEYIRTQCGPKDGKLLAIGHSMGGFEGRDSGLVSVTALASSLDYTLSKSSLRLLLPEVVSIRIFNVPTVPVGALIAAAYLFSSHPPYILSWLKLQISAPGMLHPELFEKLCLNSFCTIPAKVFSQLETVFQEGGLRNRDWSFLYKDHLGKINVPVLAIAGDQDLICPPKAVYETVKMIPEHLVTYKVYGDAGGPHYAHYDVVGGQQARHQVYPCIVNFLDRYDL